MLEAYSVSIFFAVVSTAGMDLCKWMTHELKTKCEESATTDHTLGKGKHGAVLKVLGLVWKQETDYFVWPQTTTEHSKAKGERKEKHFACIFDPIGFLTPFTIRIKCVCVPENVGLTWDSAWTKELPPDLTLECVQNYTILPYQGGTEQTCSHFSRSVTREKCLQCSILPVRCNTKQRNKSRIAPPKKMTLPRLELMGAVIGARLASNLTTQNNGTNTDQCGQTRLCCIGFAVQLKNGNHLTQTVTEIQSLTNRVMVTQWRENKSSWSP